MLKYLISYNYNNYGRWLPNHWASKSSLPDQRYKFFTENFTQSLTRLPYSYQGMDLWIECTMKLGSKLKQGWSKQQEANFFHYKKCQQYFMNKDPQ